MSEIADPIDFASHYEKREAYVRIAAPPNEALATRYYWNDIHHAKNYLQFTITPHSIANGTLVTQLLDDFGLPEEVNRQHVSSAQQALIAMRKRVVSIFSNLEYEPAVYTGEVEDVYRSHFDEAVEALTESADNIGSEARALNIIWRLHRISISDPRVNTDSNPYIPAAITAIVAQRANQAASK